MRRITTAAKFVAVAAVAASAIAAAPADSEASTAASADAQCEQVYGPQATYPPSVSATAGGVEISWNASSRTESWTVVREVQANNGRWSADGTVGTFTTTSTVDSPAAGTYRYYTVSNNCLGSNTSGVSASITVGGSSGSDSDGAGGTKVRGKGKR